MRKYYPQLAWLRGIAALFVVAYHVRRGANVSYTGEDIAVNNIALEIFDLGDFGVLLFFVLSGTTLYLNHRSFDNAKEIGQFYIKRFFRIWPAFAISMIIFIAFIPIFNAFYIENNANYWVEVHANNNYSFTDILRYLSLTFNLTGPAELFNIVYWSLPLEFQYYLLFPLIVFSFRFFSYFGPIIIGGALYALLHTSLGASIANPWTLMLAFTFCGGVLIGYLHDKFNQKICLPVLPSIVLLISFIILATFINHEYESLPSSILSLPILGELMNMLGVISIIIVCIALFTDFAEDGDSLGAKIMAFLGEISYSVYLYHTLFIAISVLFVIHFDINSENMKLSFMLIFTLFFTLIFSYLSYKYIELPSIKLGRKYAPRKIKVDKP